MRLCGDNGPTSRLLTLHAPGRVAPHVPTAQVLSLTFTLLPRKLSIFHPGCNILDSAGSDK